MDAKPDRQASLGSRLRQILQHGVWAGMMVNVGMIPLFWVMDIRFLAVFSVFSALLYAGCLRLIQRRRVLLVVVVTYLEVVGHVSTMVLALGWDGGFQYYLIVILPLVFIGSAGYPRAAGLVAASLGVAFLALDRLTHSMSPQVVVDTTLLGYFRYFNTVAAFGLASYVAWSYTRIVRRAERDLARIASIDVLSGLMNRRRAGEMIRREIARCRRSGRPLSFILADIDDFKGVNDRLGHEAGDRAIRHISDVIIAAVRSSDIVARWGGEEFLVALPETSVPDARRVAERIRHDVAVRPVDTEAGPVAVTMTLGVAAYVPGQTLEQCLAQADGALYEGKRAGKNVVLAAG